MQRSMSEARTSPCRFSISRISSFMTWKCPAAIARDSRRQAVSNPEIAEGADSSEAWQVPDSTIVAHVSRFGRLQNGPRLLWRPVKQKQYKSFVIPSNPLALQVLDVPLQGRPANFGGHVGNYQFRRPRIQRRSMSETRLRSPSLLAVRSIWSTSISRR